MGRRRKHKMSKIIKLTPECIEQCCIEFSEYISKARVADGKVSFQKIFNYPGRRATLYFDPGAWIKMDALVRKFDDEVAWHGVAFRGDDPKTDEYFIQDIIVYPQEVTGATVNTDQAEYENWLMSLEDDVFNNVRMQGHSHVNMGVTPSGVDTTHQEKILEQLDDDMFYIFVIWNKRGEKTVKIYDLAKNVLFETADVDVKIAGSDLDLDEFIGDAKKMVKKKSYSYAGPSYSNPYYGGGYNIPAAAPYNPLPPASANKQKTPPAPASASQTKKSGKKKEKFIDFDGYNLDEDDPYSAFGYSDDRFYQ